MAHPTGSPPEPGVVRIALDAMGADFEPEAAVHAACRAVVDDPRLELRVFGDPDALDAAVCALPDEARARIELAPTSSFVPMDVSPAQALRHGRASSMAAALGSVAEGRDAAVVSAGSTGALMALGRIALGMLPGVERPALMTAFPVREGRAWVLDLGANIGVDADRLLEFALLGRAAVGVLLGRRPRVGLLNIGKEPSKGPDVIREASRRLAAQAEIDFVGFVEGHDVFAGRADVVVCDGFAGNILLKSAEGAIGMLLAELADEARRPVRGLGLRRALGGLRERYDPALHNGASLLGINGIVIKSHAHASVDGLANAIGLAALEVRRGLIPALERQLWAEA
ncbi:phosphate acyltransferase PlsX [Wenzhouxiangella sp. XN79A]|uniref:phosphate acyltransferase PlsX n=1 Tax=Wenzhouxiangella sp. XN79A TaxID=2724193 RepID=UPI00144A944C|nr:phosphate acyltransferase PlsX [Wenzhouxiangella sp. XN79A]NKI34476.1 phosphate acyltransferase PlsX [Wenzhouxiangella sp. XN79A]